MCNQVINFDSLAKTKQSDDVPEVRPVVDRSLQFKFCRRLVSGAGVFLEIRNPGSGSGWLPRFEGNCPFLQTRGGGRPPVVFSSCSGVAATAV